LALAKDRRVLYRVLEERRLRAEGKEVDMSDILDGCQKKARDHARTPIQVSRKTRLVLFLSLTLLLQWNASAHGGFTSGTPWMRVNDDYKSWNVEIQERDPNSVLAFWKQALRTRKEHDILVGVYFFPQSVGKTMRLIFTRLLCMLLGVWRFRFAIPTR
jgi:oligo-1,6-glucosidase